MFAGAGVAIILGMLFWTSVWIVFRSPGTTTKLTEASATARAQQGANAAAATERDDDEALSPTPNRAVGSAGRQAVTAREDEEALSPAPSRAVERAGRQAAIARYEDDPLSPWLAAARPVGLDEADEQDEPGSYVAMGPGAADERAYWDEVERQAAMQAAEDADVLAEGPIYGPFDELSEGPIYGPFEVAAAGDDPGTPKPVDPFSAQVAATAGEFVARVEAIAARADEMTVRAEELTARAEELAVKLEGLAAKMEELEAKLEANGAALRARPALVPSPVPTTARRNEPVTVRANSQSLNQSQPGARAPWVVGPLPEPGSRVTAGPLILETRARGAAPITQIRLQLDGVPLAVSLEKRDDNTWRGRAATRVTPGPHTVAVSVVDGQGRIGSYRWQFDAAAQ